MIFLMADTIGGELRDYRKRRGWSQGELGKRIKVSAQFVSKMEGGDRPIPPETLDKLISMGFSPGAGIVESSETFHPIFGEMVKVEVSGKAAAGDSLTSVDDGVWDEIPKNLYKCGKFAFKIDGISMAPRIPHGSIGVFKPTQDLIAGFGYLFKDDQDGFMVKVLIWKDHTWMLQSLNPNFPDISFRGQMLGKLIGFYHSIDSGRAGVLDYDPHGLRLDIR